jgi:ABC-type sugar transport system ATPase subunit
MQKDQNDAQRMSLRKKLRRGDIVEIASLAGASYDTTWSILSGRRGKRGGIRIKSIAEKFVANREALRQEIGKQ